MRFYNREKELEILNTLDKQTADSAKMVVITGRRRIGKTELSIEFTKDRPSLYLFVSRKSEKLLCREYIKQIQETFEVPIIGEITEFKEVFKLLLEISKKTPFILVIDEFQEFITINPSVFSDIQNLWDQNKAKSKMMVLFMGSVYSLMNKIFQDSNEPLFGRADRVLHLKPFSLEGIHQILKDYNHPDATTLFNYYMLSGGSPKYIDIFISNSLFSFDQIINFAISEYSPLLNEGTNVLIEEFGKEYAIYFSILELIASGKTSRSEIESILQHNIGGHLERLEKDYAIIKKYRPINSKPGTKLVKYLIFDHFLRFWFRFIFHNRTAIETGNYSYVKKDITQNIRSYSGRILEDFFHNLFASSCQYNQIGSYWEKGHLNKIDLVALNDQEKQIVIAEIKHNKNKISLNKLKAKSIRLVDNYKNYHVEYLQLSLEDAKDFLPD